MEIFEGKLGLNDTSGLHSGSQHILLGGHVAWCDQSLQVIQVAEGKWNSLNTNSNVTILNLSLGDFLLSSGVVELVLWGPVKARLYASVLPQAQYDVWHLFRHGAFLNGVCKMHEFPGIILHGHRQFMFSSSMETWTQFTQKTSKSIPAVTCWSAWP